MIIKLLTREIALEYQQKAAKISSGPQDIGERRMLRMELQAEYDLSELEALNILNGHNVRDIITISNKRATDKAIETEVRE